MVVFRIQCDSGNELGMTVYQRTQSETHRKKNNGDGQSEDQETRCGCLSNSHVLWNDLVSVQRYYRNEPDQREE
jgi:hypothetical protein